MTGIMRNKLFIDKTHCLTASLSYDPADAIGRLGGNAPACFDAQEVDPVHRYSFYLTVTHPLTPEKMISVFIPYRFDLYNQNNIYPTCAIKVFTHEHSPESTSDKYLMMPEEPEIKKTKYQKEKDYSKPLLKKSYISSYKLHNSATVPEGESFFVQTGGEPFWIQGSSHYRRDLEADGYQYFMYIDEWGYLEDSVDGNMPLCFGGLYLDGRDDFSDIIAGFWQST